MIPREEYILNRVMNIIRYECKRGEHIDPSLLMKFIYKCHAEYELERDYIIAKGYD